MPTTEVHVVPHTHWDREWYEPFQRFRMGLVDLVDHVLDEADADPRFAFTFDGQVATVDDYLEIRPAAEGRVRRLVQQGQLAVGPWQILSDEFLVSGETLVRNLELGWRRAEELGGVMPVGYLPDQFGHIAQMPQILRRAGIADAVLWRGVPAAIQHHAFRWQAPDGSVVSTEYLPGGYGVAAGLFDPRADPIGELDRVIAFLRSYGADEPLAMCGNDHTWPPTGLAQIVAGLNAEQTRFHVRLATLAAYVAGTADGVDLPRWTGELRSGARANLLMGVTSARIPIKRAQTRVERLLERYAEPWQALWGDRWPQTYLDLAWRKVIESSAHDSVTGCGVDAVATQVLARLAEAEQIATGLRDRVGLSMASGIPAGSALVLNPSPYRRVDLASLPDGELVRVAVPALGWAVTSPGQTTLDDAHEVRVSDDGIANGLLAVSVEDAGTVRLQTSGGLVVGGVGRLVSGGDVGDLYNFGPPPDDVTVDLPISVTSRVLDASPLRATLEVVRAYRWPAAATPDRLGRAEELRDATVRMLVELRAGEKFVRLVVIFENPCRDHRLRLHVPLPRPAHHSYAEGQFFVVRRGSTAEGGVGEEPLPTFPARGWVDAGGVALLLDHVSEYEVLEGAELALTVLRAVGQISRSDHPLRKVPAGPESPTPAAQLLGEQEFRMAVLPHEGDWLDARVSAAAERYHHPFFAVAGAGQANPDVVEGEGLAVHGSGVVLTSLRRRDEWLEIRLLCEQPSPVVATVTGRFNEAREVDLLGRPGAGVTVHEGTVEVDLSAWELRTISVRRVD